MEQQKDSAARIGIGRKRHPLPMCAIQRTPEKHVWASVVSSNLDSSCTQCLSTRDLGGAHGSLSAEPRPSQTNRPAADAAPHPETNMCNHHLVECYILAHLYRSRPLLRLTSKREVCLTSAYVVCAQNTTTTRVLPPDLEHAATRSFQYRASTAQLLSRPLRQVSDHGRRLVERSGKRPGVVRLNEMTNVPAPISQVHSPAKMRRPLPSLRVSFLLSHATHEARRGRRYESARASNFRDWGTAASRRKHRVCNVAFGAPRYEGAPPSPPRAAVHGLVRPVRDAPPTECVFGGPRLSASRVAPTVADCGGIGYILHRAPTPPVAPFGDPGGKRSKVTRQMAMPSVRLRAHTTKRDIGCPARARKARVASRRRR